MQIVYDPLYGDHLRGVRHPESPDRVEAVAAFLRERGSLGRCVTPRDATDAELERVHDPHYIETVKHETAGVAGAADLSTGDVTIDARSLAVARRAAGGAIAAVETAVSSREPVFGLLRPPGHHAEAARGMGFCLFNNAAIAARHHLAAHGGRVLIVDIDYHHGNGTQAVAGDGLSYVSTHGYPAYPGTGGIDENYRLRGGDVVANVPLPPHAYGTEAFVATWSELLPLVARAVRPQLLVISAGFDYVAGDPVGDLGVDPSAAHDLVAAINAVAAECDAAVAYLLEGGYGIAALMSSIAAVIESSDARRIVSSDAQRASIPAMQRSALERISAV